MSAITHKIVVLMLLAFSSSICAELPDSTQQPVQDTNSKYHHARPYYHQAPRQIPPITDRKVVGPSILIRSIISKLKRTFAADTANNPAMILGFLQREVVPHIAFTEMTRWIVGTQIAHLNQQELVQFETQLKKTFLAALAKHMGSFNFGETRIRVYPARYRNNGEAIVRARVFLANTIPLNLDFRLLRNNRSWQLVDVKANGFSALIYYRSHFRSQLAQYAS